MNKATKGEVESERKAEAQRKSVRLLQLRHRFAVALIPDENPRRRILFAPSRREHTREVKKKERKRNEKEGLAPLQTGWALADSVSEGRT